MMYLFDGFALDDQCYELRFAGEVRKIEPKVFELLDYLIRHRDRFVSRDELSEKLWPDVVVSEAALTQCVAKARRAVHDDSSKQHVIKTQHGRGYRFVAHVVVQEKRLPTDPPPPVVRRPSVTVRPFFPHDSNALAHGRFGEHWPAGSLVLLGFALTLATMALFKPASVPSGLSAQIAAVERRTALPQQAVATPDLQRSGFLSFRSPEASAYYLRGADAFSRFTPETNAQARQLFLHAVAVDPQYAAAYVYLGWTYLIEWDWCWTHDPWSLEQALAFAHTALVANDALPSAYVLLSRSYLLKKDYERAQAAAEHAISLDPACADCYLMLADLLAVTGQAPRAIDLVYQAKSLDPVSATDYAAVLGQAYVLTGQPELAIPALHRALIRNPHLLLARLHLALAYSNLGLEKAAKATLIEGLQFHPQLSLDQLRVRFPHQNARQRERLLLNLRRVGLE